MQRVKSFKDLLVNRSIIVCLACTTVYLILININMAVKSLNVIIRGEKRFVENSKI